MTRHSPLFLSAIVVFVLVLAALWWRITSVTSDFSPQQTPQQLVVYSTTDSSIFAPLIQDFETLNPNIRIVYHELDAAALYNRFVKDVRVGRPEADLLISSAMDLQVKLVNDGFAIKHSSPAVKMLPDWARWRDEAFGITFEPIAMVFNRRLMEGRRIPASRAELIDDFRADPTFWHGKIGTYDISRSSTGYLLATQDDRLNSEFANLVNEMSKSAVSVEESTAVLLDRVARGDLAMGYNLLGSYATRLENRDSPIVVVYPSDYTLALSRTAVIPASARNEDAARQFLDYLLSARGQRILTADNGLYSILSTAQAAENGLRNPKLDTMRPIVLGPGLLVYLDGRKRAHQLVRMAPLSSTRPIKKP